MSTEAIGDLSFVLHGNEREPMIKGTPMHVKVADRLSSHGADASRRARQSEARRLQARMQERSDVVWDGIPITMTEDAEGFTYGVPPEHAQRAMELEYGTEEERPQSVFRAILSGQHEPAQRRMQREIGMRWQRG